MGTKAAVSVKIDNIQLMHALRHMTLYDEKFDHRAWSLAQADDLVAVARMIREGYGHTEKE